MAIILGPQLSPTELRERRRKYKSKEYNAKRTRNSTITIKVTEEEKAAFHTAFKESGYRTLTDFFLASCCSQSVPKYSIVESIETLTRSVDKLYKQFKGIGTNANQIARKVNSGEVLKSAEELNKISNQLASEVKRELTVLLGLIHDFRFTDGDE